jgi:endogenous inhibitor of DNA gyrase (YacG/DUF329 family)
MSCPICARTTAPAYRPFCSRRCADIDLGRWLKGGYAIPASDEDAPDEAETGGRPAEDPEDR